MKVADARDVLRVALETGPWPVTELVDLAAVAASCDPRTVHTAASQLRSRGEMMTVRRVYWVSCQYEDRNLSRFLEGYPRQSLLAQLVPSQSSVTSADEIELELARDAWVDVMGAETLRRGRRAAA